MTAFAADTRVEVHNLGDSYYLLPGGRRIPPRCCERGGCLGGLIFSQVPIEARIDADPPAERAPRLRITSAAVVEKTNGTVTSAKREEPVVEIQRRQEEVIGELPRVPETEPEAGSLLDRINRRARKRRTEEQSAGVHPFDPELREKTAEVPELESGINPIDPNASDSESLGVLDADQDASPLARWARNREQKQDEEGAAEQPRRAQRRRPAGARARTV